MSFDQQIKEFGAVRNPGGASDSELAAAIAAEAATRSAADALVQTIALGGTGQTTAGAARTALGAAATLNGAGAPSDATDGANGDFWIRTSNWTIYGPKTAGAWGAPTSIIGATGATGAAGAAGVVPDAGTTSLSTTHYSATLTTRPEPLTSGYAFLVKFNATNLAASDIALSAGTAQPLYSNGAALPAGAIVAGCPYLCRSNGTQVEVLGEVGALALIVAEATLARDASNLSSGTVPDARLPQPLSTGVSPQFAGIEVGHASDTTITRVSAGVIAIEGVPLQRGYSRSDAIDTLTPLAAGASGDYDLDISDAIVAEPPSNQASLHVASDVASAASGLFLKYKLGANYYASSSSGITLNPFGTGNTTTNQMIGAYGQAFPQYARISITNGASPQTYLKVYRNYAIARSGQILRTTLTPGAMAANAVYDSGSIDLLGYNRITILTGSSHASASSGLQHWVSGDGVAWALLAANLTLTAGVLQLTGPHSLPRYLRIRLTNGATPSTACDILVIAVVV